MSIAIVGSRLPAALGPAGEVADLADEAPGEGDEIAGRQSVRGLLGVHGGCSPSAAGDTT